MSTPSPRRTGAPRIRRSGLLVLAAGLLAAAALFLWPDGRGIWRINLDLWLLLRRVIWPEEFTPEDQAAVLNALVFAVLAGLLAWTFPRVRLRWWALAALLGTVGIEGAQAVLGLDREVSAVDIAANLSGALLVLGAFFLARRYRTSSRSTA